MVYPDIGKTLYMVCDNEDISTPGLAIEIGRALQLKTRLMPCPVGVLRAAGVLLGRTDAINRLCHNLQVDMSESMDALKWRPPQTLRAGLRDMAHVLITER